ncbi:MAG TPA: DUF3987 domain-containing protein [Anaerolineae bacterium]|nr:DUF3987 domain-containing protein [Anaerolineae bacterium]
MSSDAIARWVQGEDLPPALPSATYTALLTTTVAVLPQHHGFRPAALDAALSQHPDGAQLRQEIAAATERLLQREDDTLAPTVIVPELPAYARLTDSQEREAADAGRYLDEYIAFAKQASPLTPRSFHEAVCLDLISKSIARRLYVGVSTASNHIYSNLYQVYIGQSTRERKTTAQNVARGLLAAANLDHLLLPSRTTTEAFMVDLSLTVPPTYEAWSQETQQYWLKRRALAAQRGFLLGEASHLLDSFSRDYTRGMLTLLLDLYDCPDPYEPRDTLNRGLEFIKRPYITVFGSTTYAAMAPHIKNTQLWNNGFFARFALVGMDTDGAWQFWPKQLEYPASLVERLCFLATELLPLPEAHLEESAATDTEGKPKKKLSVVIRPPLTAHAVTVTPEAWEHWERYSEVVSWDMAAPDSRYHLPPRFQANYGRFGVMLIKVAVILAALDATQLPVVVHSAHVYRAQMIVERWRANLHRLTTEIRRLDVSDEVQDIKAALAARGTAWVSGREIYRPLSISSSRFEQLVARLGDEVEARQRSGSGPKSMEYRLAVR